MAPLKSASVAWSIKGKLLVVGFSCWFMHMCIFSDALPTKRPMASALDLKLELMCRSNVQLRGDFRSTRAAGFQLWGVMGGGVNRALQIGEGGGLGKRAQLTRPIISIGTKGTRRKFYCLQQVHLVENLPQATHIQNRVKTTSIRAKICFTYLGWSF